MTFCETVFRISLRDELFIWTLLGILHLTKEMFWSHLDVWNIVGLKELCYILIGEYRDRHLHIQEDVWPLRTGIKNEPDDLEYYSRIIYIIAYICMFYPLYTKRCEFMLWPWLVIAGTRFYKSFIIPRLYLFLLVFRYWSWMLDEASLRAKIANREAEEKIRAAILQGNRRLSRGIRPHLVRKRSSEILKYRDIYENGYSESTRTPSFSSKFPTFDPLAPTESSLSSNNLATASDEPYNYLTRRETLCDPTKATITQDCVVAQIVALCKELVSCKRDQRRLSDSSAIRAFVNNDAVPGSLGDIFLSHSSSVVTTHADMSEFSTVNRQIHPPEYISVYPKIFSKRPTPVSLPFDLKFNLWRQDQMAGRGLSDMAVKSRRTTEEFGANFPDLSADGSETGSTKKRTCIRIDSHTNCVGNTIRKNDLDD